MAYALFAILLTLPVIYARIEINITVSPNPAERHVTPKGSNIDLISEKERNSFHLEDSQLKKAVKAFFGMTPINAYLRSPTNQTPGQDLYQSNNWIQVYRTLTPQRATILSFKSEPYVSSEVIDIDTITPWKETISNNVRSVALSNVDGRLVSIDFKVTQSVNSTWQFESELDVGPIKYVFSCKNFTDQTDFSYTSNWGEDASRSNIIEIGPELECSSRIKHNPIGPECGIYQVKKKPNQIVTRVFSALKSTMQVQVDYEASLSGDIAVEAYKDSSWALDLNRVMRTSGLETTIKSSEVIQLHCFSHANLVYRVANADTDS